MTKEDPGPKIDEPETVELGEATVRDGDQVWMDGEFLGFHGNLKPGKWRITATRVGSIPKICDANAS